MRADHMACAGNPVVHTPALDRIAARGTTFPGAHCNNPICMPARASMLTGLLPRDHGLCVNGQSLRRDLPVLPQLLADAGYATHAGGKLHLTPWVPGVEPPDTDRYPECLACWQRGDIAVFPEPYYGFQSVDFVGGHVSFVYGPYIEWLRSRGGDPALLTPAYALAKPTGAPSCFKAALPEDLHYNRYIADSAIRLIDGSAAGDRPFFAWCSFPDPHMPCAPPRPYCDMYDPADVPPPVSRDGELDDLPPVYRRVLSGATRPNGIDNRGVTEAHWREMIALTYGMVTHVDTEVGRVLDALERAGQADRTVIIFISDHGDMMGDHGLLWKAFYTFRGCIRIPFIVSAPGYPGGRTSPALVSQVDLLPSVLDLCGVDMPGSDWSARETPYARGSEQALSPYPGRSWRGLLEDPAGRIRDSVVIENDDPTSGYRVRALVTESHRLSVYPGTGEGELFDLGRDPHELRNLWYDPAHSELRSGLTAQLLDAYSRDTPLHPIPSWNA